MTVNKEISIFVDESGSFAPMDADPNSPYYLLCMVFHNQSDSITIETANLDEALAHLGIPLDCAVHAGPLIRREAETDMEAQVDVDSFFKVKIVP